MTDQPLNIHRLEAENFRRIEAVAIEPGGDPLVRIVGPNGAGKTSVIDALAMGIGGPRLRLPEPVRTGAKKASVKVDIGDYVIERSITSSGKHRLKVLTRDGAKVKRPQEVLDDLVAPFSFDPLAFLKLPRADLARQLSALVNLDTATLDQDREAAAEERRTLKAQLQEAEGALSAAGPAPPTGDGPTAQEVTALEAEAQRARNALASASEAAAARARAEAELRAIVVRVGALVEERKKIRREIAALEGRLKELAHDETSQRERYAAERAAYDATTAFDVSVLRGRTEAADAALAAAREEAARHHAARAQRGALAKQAERVAALRERLAAAEKKVAFADEEKRRRVAEARFPVAGLGFDPEGYVTLNGHPFEAASHAEQLRCAVGMGFAANPRLKVLLVRDGSLLDARSLRLVAEMAEQHGGQVWLEEVARGGEGSGFLIEEGRLVEDRSEDGEGGARGAGDEMPPARAPMPASDLADLDDLGEEDFDLDALAGAEFSQRVPAREDARIGSEPDGLDLPEMD